MIAQRFAAWGLVRIVTNSNLLMIEKSLAIMLGYTPTPSDGYRLAADYCRHARISSWSDRCSSA